MSSQKKKLLVVYEDASIGVESLAKNIKKCIGVSANTKVRCASEVSVPEILAAEAYLFGVADAQSTVWNELRRLFSGINLAGRHASLFRDPATALGGDRQFLESLKPTDVSVHPVPLTSGKDASAWLQSL